MYNYIYYVVSLGRGVFSTKTFFKDDFLLVYKGELVTADEGCRREDSYNPDLGSFPFFLKMVPSAFGKPARHTLSFKTLAT